MYNLPWLRPVLTLVGITGALVPPLLLPLVGTATLPAHPAQIDLFETSSLQAKRPANHSWSAIWARFRRRKPSWGSRGGCLLGPGVLSPTVWSDRPLFLVYGRFGRIDVLPKSEMTRTVPLSQISWQETYPGSSQPRRYSVHPLQSGQTYVWQLYFSRDSEITTPMRSVEFQVLHQKKRDLIESDLQKLEQSLRSDGAKPEDIVLARAQYFADRNLWADVLQEIFSVPQPSPELQQVIEALPDRLCS